MLPIAEGEHWVYRKANQPLREVIVLKVVSQSGNSRVRIQFEEGSNAGQAEWVSRRMLKVLWADKANFADRESRWHGLRQRATSIPQDDLDAAELVLEETVDPAIARAENYGLLAVFDLASLIKMTGMTTGDVQVHGSFEEDSTLYLEWPALRDVAMNRARTEPATVLEYIEREAAKRSEEDLRNRQIEALSPWSRTPNDDYYWESGEATKRAWDAAREWCGEGAMDRWAEITHLRDENTRLTRILGRALDALGEAGRDYQAKRFRREAGQGFM